MYKTFSKELCNIDLSSFLWQTTFGRPPRTKLPHAVLIWVPMSLEHRHQSLKDRGLGSICYSIKDQACILGCKFIGQILEQRQVYTRS